MKTLTKVSAALGLILTLASVPASATVDLATSVDCGSIGRDSSNTAGSWCRNTGEARAIAGGSFDYDIQATAANGYELGGLRTFAEIKYDGLQEGRAGADSFTPAGAYSRATIEDTLHFNFASPTAVAGSVFTMRSVVRMHGNNDYGTADESRFYDGNTASMISELVVIGLGRTSTHHQFHSSVSIFDGGISILGSSDDTAVFEQSVTLYNNNSFNSYLKLQLATTITLINGFLGSVGVGSGVLGADFSSTAGVVSIEFFDSNGGLVDYALTSDGGQFAFLAATAPVPEPSTSAMMLLGLCAIAGFAQRRRRNRAAATA